MAKEPKEMVTVRLQPSARRRIKALAERLQANESDILRFAIEVALDKLSPLCDPVFEGTDLVPALAEHGLELGRALELDASKLNAILNDDLEDESKRVPRDVIVMLLGGGQTKDYMDWVMRINSGAEKVGFSLLPPSAYLKARYPDPREIEAIEQEIERHERDRRISR